MVNKTVGALVLMAAALAAVLTGCTSPLTVEQVVEKTAAAAEAVQSYRAEMSMTVTANGQIDGESMDLFMNMTSSLAVDQANHKMAISAHTDMQGVGAAGVPAGVQMPTDTDMAMYILGNEMYMQVDMPVVGPTWMKTELREGSWEEENPVTALVGQATLAQQIELLEAAHPELLGEEKVDGVACYKIKLTPDLAQILSLLMDQSAIPDMDISSISIDMQSLFRELSVVEWVAKDTFLLYKTEVNIDMFISPETMHVVDMPGEGTVEMHLVVTASDYNKPLDIVLPDEAKNAISMPSMP